MKNAQIPLILALKQLKAALAQAPQLQETPPTQVEKPAVAQEAKPIMVMTQESHS